MLLTQVLENISTQQGIPDIEVSSIARDSRKVEKNSLFFCISGVASDGHDYAQSALDAGATAVVVERDLGLEQQIIVENSHQAYGIACGNYYGNPAQKLKLIGVTGTNGKTTITYIVKGILEWAGKKTGLIGTIENKISNITLQARHTTPDPYELHALFARMVEAECEYVVMEVSSHALDQYRVAGCQFVSAGFTNLTQDHLDYHGTMDEYFGAKKKLFSMAKAGVINQDDSYGGKLLQELTIPTVSFSAKEPADLWASDIQFSEKGSFFQLHTKENQFEASFIQPGLFSVSNALCGAGLCLAAGLSEEQVIEGLAHTGNIPGRFEILPTNTDYMVVRDFAHSPDGLEKLLSTVREFATGRIVTLFGCAGERDRSKRKIMSGAVAKYSDFCIMTADNPRSEPVTQILEDAMPGLENANVPYKIFEDRFDALLWALQHCQKNDYLILAGKGHEDYQVLADGSINFDEKQIVLDLLQRITNGETWETPVL